MKIIYILLIPLCLSLFATAQTDVIISGNSGSSAMICSSGKIFTWGSNQLYLTSPIPYKGVLGVGSNKPYETLPAAVVGTAKFNNLTFKQVSAGSGHHFLALACDGSVWAWGSNTRKQLGTGSPDSIATVPAQVKAGVLTGTSYDDGQGFLTGVKIVRAGNTNSFALLNDGRVVSWGSNSIDGNNGTAGMLGDGSQVQKPTPVFVIDGNTMLPITNVLDISPGENVAYALKDDDSDKIGTVYSWGQGINGTLGRNADGTPFVQLFSNILISSYALPVRLTSGPTLSNITSISAGDVFMMALDTDGYIWSWGNGAWGGCTGQGAISYMFTGQPRKVLIGDAAEPGAVNPGKYLKAKSISGGQGFAMAVTLDGKPMTWGNNGGCTGGGYLGDGSSALNKMVPTYIINALTNKTDSNVVSINRGDVFGFYITKDKKIFAWGCNLTGQLGIGDTINTNKAVPVSLNISCGLKDLKPYAKFLTVDTTLCKSALGTKPLLLKPELSIADSSSQYQATWYLNNNVMKGPLATSNPQSRSFQALLPGVYKFKLKYTGTKGDCNGYPDAETSVNIKAYEQGFTVPNELTYKGDTLKPKVTMASNASSSYAWYGSATSTVPLANSKGTNATAIAKNNPAIVSSGNGNFTIYVEESSTISGTVLKKDSLCDPKFEVSTLLRTDTSNTPLKTQYVAFEKIKLSSFKIMLKTHIPEPGTLSGQLNFVVYSTKTGQFYNIIPDTDKKLGSFNIMFKRTRSISDSANNNQELTVPINITIPGDKEGYYFYIAPADKALTNKAGQGIVYLGRQACSQLKSLKDDWTGKILNLNGSQYYDNENISPNSGDFFDLKFETAQGFCDRISVIMKPEVLTSADVENSASKTLILYPNPSHHSCMVNVAEAGTLRIINLQGVEVLRKNVLEGSNTIGLNGLPESSYIVEFSGENIQQRTKLIVE